jgi:hypothetical protein
MSRAHKKRQDDAPLAGWLDPERTRSWRFGGVGGDISPELRHSEQQQQQNVTNDSGPEVG